MAYEVNHIALSVSDLDKSVAWYSSLFGFQEIKRFEKGDMKIVWLALGSFQLELFEGSEEIPEYRKELMSDLGTRGTKHFAFGVDDIDASYKDLISKGVVFEFEPEMGASGKKYAFFKDPDGILLEIIEK